ncbi:COG4315 family predicted lipoprotein [Streptomyces sp. NPDC054863]
MHASGPVSVSVPVSRISAAAAATALLLALGGGAAHALDTPTDPGELTVIDTSEGKALADKNGNALYAWAGDAKDTSNCTGECAKNWPAATGYPTKSADVTGQTNQIDLAGSDKKQVVLDEKPLYYFKGDAKPGDTKGNGVKGADGKAWGLVGPDGKVLGAAAAVPAASDSPAASDPPAASESPSASASGDASASASASPGTATPVVPPVPSVPGRSAAPVVPSVPGKSDAPGEPTTPGRATPSGAVKAGAEEGQGGSGAAGIVLGLGGAAAIAAAGAVFVVRRRNAHAGGDS